MNNATRTAAVSLGILAVLAVASCGAGVPATVGQYSKTGQLAPCPDTPNCVSTQAPAADTEHYMEPIPFQGSAEQAKARLRQVVQSMPRTKVTADEGSYLRVEYTSLVFRFVDDVEFVIDEATHTIQFRSASRVGRGDMGVNRKRMAEVTQLFTQQG